jgi:hypothetical protein
MAYLKEQQPIPSDVTVTGVPVTIQATGPDGSTTVIGTATSDMSGNYFAAWAPPDTGLYKITATFVGSESYGSSYDEAAVVVNGGSPSPFVTPPVSGETPSSSTTPPGGEAPAIDVYLIAAAIVVIIVVLLAALVLRRRRM